MPRKNHVMMPAVLISYHNENQKRYHKDCFLREQRETWVMCFSTKDAISNKPDTIDNLV